MKLSLVIPVYNEAESIGPLVEAIAEKLGGVSHEVVFVDDGSSDATVEKILALPGEHIRLVQLARNFGQTSAMAAGIEAADGEFIATLDGDLQNDPADIPVMLERLENEKLDVVVGWRKKRMDGLLLRKIPSKIANFLIRTMTKVSIHDYGCTLKVFRTSLAKKLDLYGELHRFIPILASMHGAKIEEMVVNHHPRQFGQTKYGLGRTFRVMSDLLLMLFFLKYKQRPMHLFGTIGVGLFLIGGIIEFYLLLEKISGNDIGHRPLFYIGILFLITAVQFITAGFIAELVMRTYYEAQDRRPYSVAKRYRGGTEDEVS